MRCDAGTALQNQTTALSSVKTSRFLSSSLFGPRSLLRAFYRGLFCSVLFLVLVLGQKEVTHIPHALRTTILHIDMFAVIASQAPRRFCRFTACYLRPPKKIMARPNFMFALAMAMLLFLSSEAFFFSRMPARLQQTSKSPQLAFYGYVVMVAVGRLACAWKPYSRCPLILLMYSPNQQLTGIN